MLSSNIFLFCPIIFLVFRISFQYQNITVVHWCNCRRAYFIVRKFLALLPREERRL